MRNRTDGAVLNSRSLAAFVALIGLATIAELALAYNSLGGIDAPRYWSGAYAINFSEAYYLKEPVSWLLIKLIGSQMTQAIFVFGVSSSILLLSLVSIGKTKGLLLYAAFLTPFGILLSFNIIRQCYGTMFLSIAFMSLSNAQIRKGVLFAILAILSHNFSLILCFGFAVSYVFNRSSVSWRIFLVFGCATIFIAVANFGLADAVISDRASSLDAGLNNDLANYTYTVYALLTSSILYYTGSRYRTVVEGMVLSLFGFIAISFIAGIETWTFGRIAISISIISTFLVFDTATRDGKLEINSLGLAITLVLLGVGLIPFHPGAVSMIGDSY